MLADGGGGMEPVSTTAKKLGLLNLFVFHGAFIQQHPTHSVVEIDKHPTTEKAVLWIWI
jgi:hypothetical protein